MPKMQMTTRALVLCDDLWHPAVIARRGLKALGGFGFDFEWLENGDRLSPARMKEFPVIILDKSNVMSAKDKRAWLTKDLLHALCKHIRRGNGLVVVHSGTAGYAELPVMRSMIGGTFVHHPPQCGVTVEPKRRQPLTIGVAPFTVEDEHYFVKLDDAQAEVFLLARSEYGVQPAGWTRAEGKGRVCVLTPGHSLKVWLHPSFQALLLNALRWAAT
jgi:type 1 glutamine amidotransferase